MIRIVALLLLLTTVVVPAQAPVRQRGPYLQMASPTAITVCWRTDLAGTGRVRCGTDAAALDLVFDAAAPATDHAVRLTGLVPATRYYYAVEVDGTALAGGAAFHFITPPPDGSAAPIRLWVLGDSGTRSQEQRAVRDAFLPVHAEKPAGLWLMLGDNAYGTGTDEEYQGAVFEMYHPWLQQIPLWSCIGNHETYHNASGDGRFAFDRIFHFPAGGECGGVASGTERYFSWHYGNIHFIALDSQTSDRSADGPMAQWLRADLQANTLPWVIVCWHHPPYTKGSHDSDFEFELVEMRENILPILEHYGVDLVLCGHSHSYERSYLLDGHYGDSTTLRAQHLLNDGNGRLDGDGAYRKSSAGQAPHEGAVYVVAGSSGQTSGGALNHPAHFLSLDELGSLVIDVQGGRLDVRFLREDFSGLAPPRYDDRFTILKGGAAPPVAASGLTTLPAGPDRAVLHWKDHSAGEESYEVLLAVAGDRFAPVAALPPDTTGCLLMPLTHGVSYSVKVIAASAAGSAESPPHSFVHDAGAPPLSPAEQWRFRQWGDRTPAGERAPEADPDGDEHVNLLEYALGSSPRSAGSRPALAASRDAAGRLCLTFPRVADPQLTYQVEFASTPAPESWAAAWSSTGPDNSAGPVTVSDPALPPGSKRFVRLRVTLTEP